MKVYTGRCFRGMGTGQKNLVLARMRWYCENERAIATLLATIMRNHGNAAVKQSCASKLTSLSEIVHFRVDIMGGATDGSRLSALWSGQRPFLSGDVGEFAMETGKYVRGLRDNQRLPGSVKDACIRLLHESSP